MYPYGNSQCQRVKRFQTQRVNCQFFQVVICLNSWKYYHLIRSCCHYTVNNKPAVWLFAAGYNHAINRYSPTWFSPEWVQSRFAETLTLTLALNPNFGESAWFRRNGFRRIGKTPANIPPYGAVLLPTARSDSSKRSCFIPKCKCHQFDPQKAHRCVKTRQQRRQPRDKLDANLRTRKCNQSNNQPTRRGKEKNCEGRDFQYVWWRGI